jgi:hypothetical protein
MMIHNLVKYLIQTILRKISCPNRFFNLKITNFKSRNCTVLLFRHMCISPWKKLVSALATAEPLALIFVDTGYGAATILCGFRGQQSLPKKANTASIPL